MKRLLPLVRFNLMETQFFRQDPFSQKKSAQHWPQEICSIQPSPWTRDGGGGGAPLPYSKPCKVQTPSFNLFIQFIRFPRSLLFAFGGWSRTGSGDSAVTGPSSDIMIFNPASRFKAEQKWKLQICNRSWQMMDQNVPQPVAYTSAAG